MSLAGISKTVFNLILGLLDTYWDRTLLSSYGPCFYTNVVFLILPLHNIWIIDIYSICIVKDNMRSQTR